MKLHEAKTLWLQHLRVELSLSANTLSNYRRDLERYIAYLTRHGIATIGEVTTETVEKYLSFLQEGDESLNIAKLSTSSANRALVVARRFHDYALQEGWVPVDVAKDVKPIKTGKTMPDVLTEKEACGIIDLIPQGESARPEDLRDRALLELLYGTGARISEITSLSVTAPREYGDMLRLTGKGDKHRFVPFGGKAREAVDHYLTRGRPQLVTARTGHHLLLNNRGGALSRQSAWAILKKRAEKYDKDLKISPHTLRHSYASHLVAGGVNVRVVQELLGHSAVTTTQIYVHLNNRQVQEVYQEAHPRS